MTGSMVSSAASRVASLLVTLALLLAGCQSSPPPTPGPTPLPVTLRVGASSAALPLLDLVVPAYAAKAPHVTISRESGDSSLMRDAVTAGRDDFALVAEPPSGELWSVPVAIAGIAIVVHPRNPVSGLTLLQIRDLFKGEVYTWTQVGGAAEDVLVLSREDGSGTRRAFEGRVMGEQRVTLTAAIMPTDAAVIETVASAPGAIGYVSLPWVTSDVKALPVEGVVPSPHSLESGSYPITMPLFFISRTEPSGEARAFVQFLLSREGQALIGQKYGRVK